MSTDGCGRKVGAAARMASDSLLKLQENKKFRRGAQEKAGKQAADKTLRQSQQRETQLRDWVTREIAATTPMVECEEMACQSLDEGGSSEHSTR